MELAGHRTIPGVLHGAVHYGGRILQPTGVRAAQAIWIAFVLVQALDGVMTLVGIHMFGLHVEANPLIAWYAHAFGPAVAVSAAKLFAIGCGAVLYLTARYGTIAALAFTYLLCAVGPWIHLLWRAAW